MRIVIEEGINNDFINRINNEIEIILSSCPIYQKKRNNIYVVEKNDFESFKVQLDKVYKEELEKGFGLVFGNYNFNERGIRCHLVILNKENCERLLDKSEQIAITLHEIGHILNYFRGSTIDEYNVYQKEQFRKAFAGNRERMLTFDDAKFENECYADFYAKRYGYSEQIKSSLLKYIEDGNKDKTIEFQKRVIRLNSSLQLVGSIKELEPYTA